MSLRDQCDVWRQVGECARLPSLMLVACAGGHTSTAACLLEHGAAVERAMDAGFTPLLIACHQGRLGCVQLCSSYGAARSFNILAHPRTAEESAMRRGHFAVVTWLLESRGWCSPRSSKPLGPQSGPVGSIPSLSAYKTRDFRRRGPLGDQV